MSTFGRSAIWVGLGVLTSACLPAAISTACTPCSASKDCDPQGLSCLEGKCQREVGQCAPAIQSDGGFIADAGLNLTLSGIGQADGGVALTTNACFQLNIARGNSLQDDLDDELLFYHAQVTGDFRATVTFSQKSARLAGLMIRDSLEPQAPVFAAMVQSSQQTFRSPYRETANSTLNTFVSGLPKGPEPFAFVVQRRFNQFEAWVQSADGGVNKILTKTILMQPAVYVGPFSVGNPGDGATFCRFSVEQQ